MLQSKFTLYITAELVRKNKACQLDFLAKFSGHLFGNQVLNLNYSAV